MIVVTAATAAVADIAFAVATPVGTVEDMTAVVAFAAYRHLTLDQIVEVFVLRYHPYIFH